jgi:hypothetical protein
MVLIDIFQTVLHVMHLMPLWFIEVVVHHNLHVGRENDFDVASGWQRESWCESDFIVHDA